MRRTSLQGLLTNLAVIVGRDCLAGRLFVKGNPRKVHVGRGKRRAEKCSKTPSTGVAEAGSTCPLGGPRRCTAGEGVATWMSDAAALSGSTPRRLLGTRVSSGAYGCQTPHRWVGERLRWAESRGRSRSTGTYLLVRQRRGCRGLLCGGFVRLLPA